MLKKRNASNFYENWVPERKKRTILEDNKAMNSINPDLKFMIENDNDFENWRLPTLAFESWSCKVVM